MQAHVAPQGSECRFFAYSELRDCLAERHPEDLAFSESVLAESEEKAAGQATGWDDFLLQARLCRGRIVCAMAGWTSR